jgi:hypothetical protein
MQLRNTSFKYRHSTVFQWRSYHVEAWNIAMYLIQIFKNSLVKETNFMNFFQKHVQEMLTLDYYAKK